MGRNVMVGGTVLVLLGLLGLAVPMFSAEQTMDVAHVGDLKLQKAETKPYAVPPWSAAARWFWASCCWVRVSTAALRA